MQSNIEDVSEASCPFTGMLTFGKKVRETPQAIPSSPEVNGLESEAGRTFDETATCYKQ